MRPGVVVLAAACGLAAAAPLHADEWTLIDVRARLANDGRVTVVETHDVVLATTGRSAVHEFGLGADQAIRLTAVTRIGPDGEPHRLRAVETVDGPDEFTYYDRGHAYYSIPPLGEDVALQYRFEYELIGAVAPSWGIAAGPGSRAASAQELFVPWQRVRQIVGDWRRAWPALDTRYRFDHDVLLADRAGQDHVFRQIDYRLEYDGFWRDTAPDTDIGGRSGDAYRAARIFDYLGPGQPAHATVAPAALRLVSLVAVPVLGLAGWGLVVASARWRRGPPIDRTFVDTRVLARSPEEIAYWLDGTRPALRDVLARLAGEGAIGIHVDRPAGHAFDDGDGAPRLHLRRVAADATLTPFERAVLDDFFGGARELTSASHRRRHAGTGLRAGDVIDRHLRSASAADAAAAPAGTRRAPSRWSAGRIGLLLALLAALAGVAANAGPLADVVPVLGLWALLTVALVSAWPTAWWYPGRAARGLLVSLVLLLAMQLTVLLMPNRPMPADAWAAAALAALAAYFLTLVRSPLPLGQGGAVADLLRMRDFAGAELTRPRPQLDDRWIPRLRALGLGPAIDRWRARHGGAAAMPPEAGERPLITTAHFTGVGPAAWVGPAGWDASLTVDDDAEPDEDDEDGEDVEDGDDGPRRSS